MEVTAGELVGVVGGGSVDRTTLLQIAAGMVRPDEGMVTFGQAEFTRLSWRKRQRLLGDQIVWIGAEQPWGHLQAYRSVAMSLVMRRSRREAEDLAWEALAQVGVADVGMRRWEALSRWEQVRVQLARGVAACPQLMIIDGLFDGLGVRRKQAAGRLLRSLMHELRCAVLLGGSDLESVLGADRVWCLDHGRLRIAFDGLAADVNIVSLMSRERSPATSSEFPLEQAASVPDATVPSWLSTNIGTMPAISRFYGITIAMYFDDHQPPHFHVRAGEFSAKIRTDTLEMLVGDLPRRDLRLVLAWAELHASELQDNWRRARAGETLQAIEPLQ